MLDRYKKSGGFKQLLQLIETCGPQKQEKFLTMIDEEDARWGAALRQKMLSVDKVFSWNDNAIAEIASTLMDITLATMLHDLKPEYKERCLKTFSHSRIRKVEDLYNTKKPTSGEIASAYIKLLEETRKMISEGHLKMEQIDPAMAIDEKIEDKIASGQVAPPKPKSVAEPVDPAQLNVSEDFAGDQRVIVELNSMISSIVASGEAQDANMNQRKIANLIEENKTLKHQVKLLREKLDQIKKMAA